VTTRDTPFLTEMDPRLQVQGSRDALAAQAVWATVGRRLVGNLTLASNDIAGFRTLLIGYGLAREDAGLAERLRMFLRWEQVAAGCRVAVNDDPAPLGARRVRRRLSERSTMKIGEAREHQILGDQRAAGLWVLYHRAACGSGLVDNRRQLTETGRQLYEGWMKVLPKAVLRKVRSETEQTVTFRRGTEPTQESAEIARLLVGGDGVDNEVLDRQLVKGLVPDGAGGTRQLAAGRQHRLAALLAHRAALESWRDALPALHQQALASADSDLAARLDEVQVTESVLAPAQTAFDALLIDGHGDTSAGFATRVYRAWPSIPASVRGGEFHTKIEPLLRATVGSYRAALWAETGKAMADGDWDRAIERMVQINGDTMHQRGGAPWARTTNRGTLDVRLPLGAPLPEQDTLSNGWRNPYYLDPLRTVQRDLLAGARA
jgi:hypothetical protein